MTHFDDPANAGPDAHEGHLLPNLSRFLSHWLIGQAAQQSGTDGGADLCPGCGCRPLPDPLALLCSVCKEEELEEQDASWDDGTAEAYGSASGEGVDEFGALVEVRP